MKKPQEAGALQLSIKKALGLPVLATASLFASGAALAQQDAAEEEIEEIIVTDTSRSRYLVDESTLGSKYTSSLLDTPQSAVLLSQAMLEDRNAMSLDDALRNVPGITLGAGEFKWMGNGPTIRGFSSRNDLYVDGIRDLGFYSRDPFNLEAVEVLLGPSSTAFGRGSTGGVINQSTKKPLDEELRSLHFNVGNAGTRRMTADLNQPISDTASFRLNLMAHESEVPGRDGAESQRYGVAPSLSMRLGSATRVTLNYLYQDSHNVPDYGLPWVGNSPAQVERNNFYGFDNDWMDNTANIFSAIVDHDINRTLSLNAQLRYADYSRSSRLTEASVDDSVDENTAVADIEALRLIYGSEGNEGVLQGQVNLRADFSTGAVEHTVVTGLELSRESAETSFAFAGRNRWLPDITVPVPSTSLTTPVGGVFTGDVPVRLSSDTSSDTIGVFAMDTIEFSEQWQLLLGLRWDEFETDYFEQRFAEAGDQSGSAQFITEDKEPSYRAALVYKPVHEGTLYLGWGTSFNPASEAVSQIGSGRGLSAPNVGLEAQQNESVEAGVKWSLWNDGLFLDASVFRIEKSGGFVSDPENPGFNTNAGIEEVTGFSVSANGSLGDSVQMTAGYTWLDGESLNTLNGNKGVINNLPENSFDLWLNWTATDRISVGGGARYVDERFWGSKSVPDYWSFDALMKYHYSDTLSFKLNLTNLTDEYYFDQLHNWHVFPGPGRGAVIAINFDY